MNVKLLIIILLYYANSGMQIHKGNSLFTCANQQIASYIQATLISYTINKTNQISTSKKVKVINQKHGVFISKSIQDFSEFFYSQYIDNFIIGRVIDNPPRKKCLLRSNLYSYVGLNNQSVYSASQQLQFLWINCQLQVALGLAIDCIVVSSRLHRGQLQVAPGLAVGCTGSLHWGQLQVAME